jgi:hypothetical protein
MKKNMNNGLKGKGREGRFKLLLVMCPPEMVGGSGFKFQEGPFRALQVFQ